MAAGPRGLPLPVALGTYPSSSSAVATRTISPRSAAERNDSSSKVVERRPADHQLPLYDGGEAGGAAYDPTLPTNENLDQCLERHQITGIALAGTIGIGILIFSGRILGLAGGLGAIISFLVAGFVVSSVMVSLAEMVSVRPVVGAIFDYPKLFVDPALGFAVGIAYWIAYTTSCVTLIVSGALICPVGDNPKNIGAWLCIPLVAIFVINFAGGVQLYADIEWCFKWLKVFFVVGLDVTMVVLNVKGTPDSNGSIGFNFIRTGLFPTGFRPYGGNSPSEIDGPIGVFLAIWTGITLAVYAFLGVEIVVVTAGEARYPKRDLPRASRRMYLWTIGFYVVSVFLVALNVQMTDPALLHLNSNDIGSSFSPFIVAIKNARLAQSPALTSAATVGLVLAAWTTANTALYAGSRTLYAVFSESTTPSLRQTVGSTSSGGTPLWAIGATLFPSLLSFLAVAQGQGLLVLDTFSAIATTSILCVYISHCFAFIRFESIASSDSLNRKSPEYQKMYYRAPRQPAWAYVGLILCSLLLLFNGWHTIYKINRGTIDASNAAAGLIGAYGGPILFVVLAVWYKVAYRLPMVATSSVAQHFPTVQDDPPYPTLWEPKTAALRWILRGLRFIR